MPLYPEMTLKEKEDTWDLVADYLATPEQERVPATNQELYEILGIKERNFYYKLQDSDFMALVVKKCLIQQKKYIPRVMAQLRKNTEEGKEKSIEMFLKYVGELADRIDHTSKGDKLPEITVINYGNSTPQLPTTSLPVELPPSVGQQGEEVSDSMASSEWEGFNSNSKPTQENAGT